MSHRKIDGGESSRKEDQIKEIPDQINRVGGSTAATCAPVSKMGPGRGCHGSTPTPPEAFDALAANPAWSCRRAARELGVSVGAVHRWRKLIKVGKRPQKPGRPAIPIMRREYEALQRRYKLAIENPRKGLVRIIRRIWRHPRAFGLQELRDLHEDLFQTSYGVVVDDDGQLRGAPIDPYSIAEEALGVTRGALFVKYLGVRAFGRATEPVDESNGEDDGEHDGDDSEQTAFEAQIHERAFQSRQMKRRARRRGR